MSDLCGIEDQNPPVVGKEMMLLKEKVSELLQKKPIVSPAVSLQEANDVALVSGAKRQGVGGLGGGHAFIVVQEGDQEAEDMVFGGWGKSKNGKKEFVKGKRLWSDHGRTPLLFVFFVGTTPA
jgi:hypothetical protein